MSLFILSKDKIIHIFVANYGNMWYNNFMKIRLCGSDYMTKIADKIRTFSGKYITLDELKNIIRPEDYNRK